MSPAPDSASRSHAGRDVAIQIGARGLNLALGVAVTVLLARALGDDGFGEWSIWVGGIGVEELKALIRERGAAAAGG